MLNLKLTNDIHVEGYNGAFYRFTTKDGKASIHGIFDNWYEAEAIDEDGNKYHVVWEISNYEAFNSGDDDCCEWDNPAEIYSYSEGKSVDAIIVWGRFKAMTNRQKCNVIEKITKSDNISYYDKIYYIQMFLLNYFTVDEIKWIWE